MQCTFCKKEMVKGGVLHWKYLWCNNDKCPEYINSLNGDIKYRYAQDLAGNRISFKIYNIYNFIWS